MLAMLASMATPLGVRAADAPADAAAAPADGVPNLKPGDPVVATVDGVDIKRSEVFQLIANLSDQFKQVPLDQLFPFAEEQVINKHMIDKHAAAANLANDPDVKKQEAAAQQQIIDYVFLQRLVDAQVTQKKLAQAYEEFLDKNQDVQEVHARHILVDTEAKAKEVIGKLAGGAKWEDVARQYATGISAKNGGDLGYFAKSEMQPPIADAAFALTPGQYTKTPVKTELGWHVIQVQDKRKRPEAQFDAVKPQLQAQLREQALKDQVAQWEKGTTIKRFDYNGVPVKDNKPPNFGAAAK